MCSNFSLHSSDFVGCAVLSCHSSLHNSFGPQLMDPFHLFGAVAYDICNFVIETISSRMFLCPLVNACSRFLQAAVAVKALGTEGEREARAEEIEIATSRWEPKEILENSGKPCEVFLSWAVHAVHVSIVQRCSGVHVCHRSRWSAAAESLEASIFGRISDTVFFGGCNLNEHENTVEPDLYDCSESMLR